MIILNKISNIITQLHPTLTDEQVTELAAAITDGLLSEEWFVADITLDGEIDGGTYHDGLDGEQNARELFARYQEIGYPAELRLLRRHTTDWEQIAVSPAKDTVAD